MQANPSSLIIRTSAFFGPWDNYNFISQVINTLRSEQHFYSVDDVLVSPTYIPDLVHASLDLLIDDEKEIWHLVNDGEISWFELARQVAERSQCDARLLHCLSSNDMNSKAQRPSYSVLKSEKGVFLSSLENALNRYFEEKKHSPVLQLSI